MLNLSAYIILLGQFPQIPPSLALVASEHELFPTKNQQHILQMLRYRYAAVSDWLFHLVLGEKLLDSLFQTDMLYFQPFAEYSKALLNLAIGVHPRSADPTIHSFKSPAELWFECERLTSYRSLIDTGLLGKARPCGKRQALASALDVLQYLEELKALQLSDEEKRLIEESRCLEIVVEVEACNIAQHDSRFRATYYRPYLQVKKRFLYAINNCDKLQHKFLGPNNQLWETGKRKKLPKWECNENVTRK